MNPLNQDQIKCLNGWPSDCIGNIKDQILIEQLNYLCITHGYGRISQLAQALEEIWRDPDNGHKKWQKFHDERMTLVKPLFDNNQNQNENEKE